MKKIIIAVAILFILFIIFVAVAQLVSLEEAKKEAMDVSLESALNNLTVISRVVYSTEGSYLGFSCEHKEAVFICEGIEELTGSKPIIYSSEEEFCFYGEFSSDNYYCTDGDVIEQTLVYPGKEGYCSGETFACPRE